MKKIILIFLAAILVFWGVVSILNYTVIPNKIKSLIIGGINKQTQKQCSLERVNLSIFKGLVIKNLSIFDDQGELLRVKEASCNFIIPEIFKKRLIIPSINIKSPVLFLERRKDNTFNIQDLFLSNDGADGVVTGTSALINSQAPKPENNDSSLKKPLAPKPGFSISVYRINVRGASLNFKDNTPKTPFSAKINNINFSAYINLPSNVKFRLNIGDARAASMFIKAGGEYRPSEGLWLFRADIEGFNPREFSAYYRDLGIDLPAGLIDSKLALSYKDNILTGQVSAQSKGFVISKDKLILNTDAEIIADLKNNGLAKEFTYSGTMKLNNALLKGVEEAGDISNISADFAFNNKVISSENIRAKLFGIPAEAKLKLTNFPNPDLSLLLKSSTDLNVLQNILKEKFKFILPGIIKGRGDLLLDIQAKAPLVKPIPFNAELKIKDTNLKLDKMLYPFENISALLTFQEGKLAWSDLRFKYSSHSYASNGTLIDFKSPNIALDLVSDEINLHSKLSIKDKLLSFSKFTGTYLNSDFSLLGNILPGIDNNMQADIKGELNADLKDLQVPLAKFKNELDKIKPSGKANIRFSLKGNVNDFKSLFLKADIFAPAISLYGLKSDSFRLNYAQSSGVIDAKLINMNAYDGIVNAVARININSDNLPYLINADILDIRLEKLKNDTALSKQQVSGILNSQFKLSGYYNDINALSGNGNITVREGKLWQLDLLKGLGNILFAQDLADIVFSEGSCTFLIKDKFISTEDLQLNSMIAALNGSVKIGFDNTIDASLDVHVKDDYVPLTGTFKDVTTAIIGNAGRFGTIKITGTLKEPKYKFKTAVVDIIKSLKDTFLGK